MQLAPVLDVETTWARPAPCLDVMNFVSPNELVTKRGSASWVVADVVLYCTVQYYWTERSSTFAG